MEAGVCMCVGWLLFGTLRKTWVPSLSDLFGTAAMFGNTHAHTCFHFSSPRAHLCLSLPKASWPVRSDGGYPAASCQGRVETVHWLSVWDGWQRVLLCRGQFEWSSLNRGFYVDLL